MLLTFSGTELFRVVFFAAAAAMSTGSSPPQDSTVLSPHRHAPIIVRGRHGTNVESLNWSGYAVTGPSGSATHVKASWIVPAIQGACGPTNAYASFWVGIDGFSSNTVEQTGTDSDCQNGVPTYYAWFEFYPHPTFIINSVKISPSDVISAEVAYDGSGRFTVSLTNNTTGQSFSSSAEIHSAQRSSAEWIAEAPSGSGGILPLADFGTVLFGEHYTGVLNTSDATVDGTTGPIGSFGGSVSEITMVGDTGAIKAEPSKLSGKGSSFSDGWISPGP
jgi:hypothetical protein